MTNTELAKTHGATTYTNRHGPDDPYIAMSVKQLDAYTQAAIAADQGPDLTSAYMAGVERGKDMAAAQAVQAEWKEAMLDGLASACLDAPVTATPREILGQIIRANVDMALSPEVSEETAFRAVQAVPLTDSQLQDWENSYDINDQLHVHFGGWGRWDWCDIAEEARRVHNVMFNEHVECNSAIDAITTAAVAHADHMAYEAMAAALGVNATALRCTVALWSENQDNLPPSVTPSRFMELVEETRLE